MCDWRNMWKDLRCPYTTHYYILPSLKDKINDTHSHRDSCNIAPLRVNSEESRNYYVRSTCFHELTHSRIPSSCRP